MSRFKTVLLYCVLTAVTLLMIAGISGLENSLDNQVKENRLRFTGQVNNAPPLVTFTTVALGSFRGLVADILWLRTNKLQEQGSYFEMVQLANWITDLQPTFAGATTYLAWNMAYNISVTSSSFEERWRWVSEGIKLIRDKAMVFNPDAPAVYQYLAWIYLHKLGNVMDDAQQYYKIRMAVQMAEIAGVFPDFDAMAAAPRGEREFMLAYPAGGSFWLAASSAGIADYPALLTAFRKSSPELPAGLASALNADTAGAVKSHLQSELLLETLKMDAREIVKLNGKYGRIDWRFPEAQAIYWASMGSARRPDGHDVQCDKVIGQGLINLFKSGKLLIMDEKDLRTIVCVPNLDIIDAVYDELLKEEAGYDLATLTSKRQYFLSSAVSILYRHGRKAKANEYYKMLQKELPREFPYDLETYVRKAWTAQAQNINAKEAQEMLSALITEGLLYLVNGDDETAVAYERMARFFYAKYQGTRGNMERLALPPYNTMKKALISSFRSRVGEAAQARLDALIAEDSAAADAERDIDRADREVLDSLLPEM